MNEAQRRQKIIATLKAHGFTQDLGVANFSFEGAIYVGHVQVDVEITIPDSLFSELPVVRLVDKSQMPQTTVAHLEAFNRICYANLSLLRLDHTDVGGSILRVIEEAKSALERSLAGNASSEIATEFPRYWDGYSIYFVSEVPSKITKGIIGQTNLFRSGSKSLFEPKGLKSSKITKVFRDAIVIPVEHEISVCEGIIQPKNVDQLGIWWSGNHMKKTMSISKLHGLLLDGLAVILTAPNAIVGLEIDEDGAFKTRKKTFRDVAMRKFLAEHGSAVGLRGYVGTDASPQFVASRNLGQQTPPLAKKNIALIGCGTIGSHLAKFLVQNGAGQQGSLLLVDNDRLSAGNLGRHLLSFEDLGRGKATALADELNRFHPTLTVMAVEATAQNVWPRIRQAELIIDASGVENLSEFLNVKAMDCRAPGKPCSLLHLFLWQNGIAAQSFLNVGGDAACYRCLKPNRQWHFDPRKDVSQKSELIANRCGDGPYLPFSVAASVSAAALGLEATLDFFSSNQGATLRTTALDPKQAKQIKGSRPSRSKECPVCSQ